jgi:hypothetical protein
MSKPKIDLTDPAISGVIRSYMDQAKLATTFAAVKDNAVRPVYALNEHTRVVEHVGSCVLFKVRDNFFGLSASHVFDSVGKYQLLFGHGNRLHSFAGDRFSSAKGRSGSHEDDPIDSSVFHFTSDIASELASSFLSLEDLDFGIADRKPELYVAAGYRVSQSRSNSKGHNTKLDRYPSVELDDKTLAPNLALIRARIREKPTDTVFLSKELEDTLIHFSHGRKLQRNEIAEPMHAAKQMREYMESLKRGGVSDVHDYYSQLCSITHPSAETVMIWFEGEKDGDQVIWRRTNVTQRDRIDRFLVSWKETNELVVAAAFIPALMSLRMLHKLDFLPKIPSLKSFPLEKMPAWKEFERHLKR